MKFKLLVVAVLCTASFSAVLSYSYRLPKNVKPIRYNLTVEPNLEEATFNGSVTIDLAIIENTPNITFHARNLTLNEAEIKIVDQDQSQLMILATGSDNAIETYTVCLQNDLVAGKNYTLVIDSFFGSLESEKIGFYLAFYYDESKQQRRFAVTDFEPADARQAFPCFDEPALKARFLINIIRPANYSSLSNEELQSTTYLGNDRYLDTFKETPKMSTYLVALVVSDFQSTNTIGRHRIFARPELISQDEFSFSLDIAPKILQALENYTGVSYELRKMEQVAVPDSHFTALGMENWGLIIYKESMLTCTNSSTLEDIDACVMLIAHEFAHQWFGNLVTAEWWNYGWLNEGFPAYFHFYIPSLLQPSWRSMDQFVVEQLHSVMRFDLPSMDSYSLNHQFEDVDDFPGNVAYNKGSSILWMIEHFLTQDVFRKGINLYLEKNKFNSVVPQDFFNALQEAVDDAGVNHLLGNLSVSEILKVWTNTVGYPVVNVRRNYERGDVTFHQVIFDSEPVEGPLNETLWHIPINYFFQSDVTEKSTKTTADFWLSQRSATISGNFKKNDWMLVNIQEAGYYRVNYDLENWNRLVNFLNSDAYEQIPVLNRAKLIEDALCLAKAGQLSFNITMDLLEYLRKEKDYIPLKTFLETRHYLGFYFEQSYNETKLESFHFLKSYSVPEELSEEAVSEAIWKEYTKYILEEPYKHFGIDEKPNDSHMDKLTRFTIVEKLNNLQHPVLKSDIMKKFEQLKKDSSTLIAADLQQIVFCEGAKTMGGKEVLEDLYDHSTDAGLKRRIKSGLSCLDDETEKIGRFLLKFVKFEYLPVVRKSKLASWLSLL